MDILKFADSLEAKYLYNEAALRVPTLKEAADHIHECYRNYLDPSNPKNLVWQTFFLLSKERAADTDELLFPEFRDIQSSVKALDSVVDSLSASELYDQCNDILSKIQSVLDKESEIDDRIKRFVSLPRRSHLKDREHYTKAWKEILYYRVNHKILQAGVIARQLSESTSKMLGGEISPGVAEITPDQMNKFRFMPGAVSAGVDDPEIFRIVWEDLKFRPIFSTYIRSVLNGKGGSQKDRFSIRFLANKAKRELAQQKTNKDLFDAPEDVAQEALNKLPAEEEWSKQMQQAKIDKKEEEEPSILSVEELENKIRERDEEHLKRQIERDRERNIRSESDVKIEKLLVKYQNY